jgi:succinate dehydrogenase / fumarate reductase, cytochrome b subunit
MEKSSATTTAAPVKTLTLDPQVIDDKYHFLLRKLHSLSGIVPIGVFLIEHLLTNSRAFNWFGLFHGGREEFNTAVKGIHGLPYLLLLEVFGIFLPLAFHAIYGIKIALDAQPNIHAYPYMANRRYTLQRITGYIAFIFIIVHLFKFRFAHWIGWGPEFMDPENTDKFEMTRRGLMQWHITQLGIIVPAWITISFYLVGLWAACYHFANGIWSFCISWGITIGQTAQRRMGYAAATVGIVLFIWGAASLYGLARG